MTHALHEFVHNTDDAAKLDDDPSAIDQLGREIRYTAEEIRTRQATPEVEKELKKAVELLMRTDAPNYEKLLPTAEAAAVTGDIGLKAIVGSLLEESFPIKEDDAFGLNDINRTTRREFTTAIQMTDESMPFPLALSRAALITEGITGEDFDETIKTSNGLMREQRKREAEEAKLRALGVYDDEKFDDAVPYDPFANDEPLGQAA